MTIFVILFVLPYGVIIHKTLSFANPAQKKCAKTNELTEPKEPHKNGHYDETCAGLPAP